MSSLPLFCFFSKGRKARKKWEVLPYVKPSPWGGRWQGKALTNEGRSILREAHF